VLSDDDLLVTPLSDFLNNVLTLRLPGYLTQPVWCR
jgi:hypothetical protein